MSRHPSMMSINLINFVISISSICSSRTGTICDYLWLHVDSAYGSQTFTPKIPHFVVNRACGIYSLVYTSTIDFCASYLLIMSISVGNWLVNHCTQSIWMHMECHPANASLVFKDKWSDSRGTPPEPLGPSILFFLTFLPHVRANLVGGFNTSENISQFGLLFHISGKIKNVPNHQPAIQCPSTFCGSQYG